MNTGLILLQSPLSQANVKEILSLIKIQIGSEVSLSKVNSTKVLIVGAPACKLNGINKLRQIAMLDQLTLAAEAREFERKCKQNAIRHADLMYVFSNRVPLNERPMEKTNNQSFCQQEISQKVISRRANQVYKRYRGF